MRFKVREIRERKGITAEALSKKSGVSRMTVYKMEYHDVIVNSDTLIAIAKALGVRVDDLIAE